MWNPGDHDDETGKYIWNPSDHNDVTGKYVKSYSKKIMYLSTTPLEDRRHKCSSLNQVLSQHHSENSRRLDLHLFVIWSWFSWASTIFFYIMSHWRGSFTLCILGKPIKELGVSVIIILEIASPVYLTPGQRTPLDLALFDPWEGFISFLDSSFTSCPPIPDSFTFQ